MKTFHEYSNFIWTKTKGSDDDSFQCIKRPISWKTNPKCAAIAHEIFLCNIYENNFNNW